MVGNQMLPYLGRPAHMRVCGDSVEDVGSRFPILCNEI